MGLFTTADPTLSSGQQLSDFRVDSAGRLLVVSGGATVSAGSGFTSRLLSSAATTNATSVKASAGMLTQINGTNKSASDRFLKVYDKATAPTVGTDTPRMTLLLPAGMSFVFDCQDSFTLGIAYAITGALADADTTAIAAGDILCLNVDYR